MHSMLLDALVADTPAAADDSSVFKIVDELHRWGAEHGNLQCWLLVDPALRDPLEEFAALDASVAEASLPINVPWAKFPRSLRPSLVPIDLSRNGPSTVLDRAIRMSLEDIHPVALARSHGRRIAGCLWTNESATSLATHVGRRTLIREGAALSYFRYFDPMVLDVLWASLTEASQRHILLGPSQHWHFVDRCGVLRRLDAPSEAAKKLALAEDIWTLTPEQREALRRVDIVNQAIAEWSLSNMRPLPHGHLDRLLSALRQAIALGLASPDDQVEFVRMVLSISFAVLNHSLMAPVWDAVRAGQRWTDATSRISREDWTSIVSSRPTNT